MTRTNNHVDNLFGISIPCLDYCVDVRDEFLLKNARSWLDSFVIQFSSSIEWNSSDVFLAFYSSFDGYFISFNHENQAFLSFSRAYKCLICLFYSLRIRLHAKQIFLGFFSNWSSLWHSTKVVLSNSCKFCEIFSSASAEFDWWQSRWKFFESFKNKKERKRRRKGSNLLLGLDACSANERRSASGRERERKNRNSFPMSVVINFFFFSFLP